MYGDENDSNTHMYSVVCINLFEHRNTTQKQAMFKCHTLLVQCTSYNLKNILMTRLMDTRGQIVVMPSC